MVLAHARSVVFCRFVDQFVGSPNSDPRVKPFSRYGLQQQHNRYVFAGPHVGRLSNGSLLVLSLKQENLKGFAAFSHLLSRKFTIGRYS